MKFRQSGFRWIRLGHLLKTSQDFRARGRAPQVLRHPPARMRGEQRGHHGRRHRPRPAGSRRGTVPCLGLEGD